MNEDLVETTIIRLDEGEKIPVNLDIFDGMICLGGPMDTWMEEQYPWMIDEKNKIKEFVLNNQKPYLGICLGCQFLGEILGGKVIKSNPPEIGVLNINILDNKKKDQIFGNFDNQIKALQWHSYEVSELNNSDVTILGSSDITKFQIFKYKNHAYGIQFHIEVDENTIIKWSKVPELKNALEKYLGKNSIDELDKLLRNNIQEMNNNTKKLYENFERASKEQKRREKNSKSARVAKKLEQLKMTNELIDKIKSRGPDFSGFSVLEIIERTKSILEVDIPYQVEQRRVGDVAKIVSSCSCLLYTSPSPRDLSTSRMPSSA